MVEQASSDYEKRLEKIEDFNLNNQWLKRGLSMVPVKFPAQWEGFQVLCLVNIHTDGSISIYHSGCEIGQGLDVKVAQVFFIAYFFCSYYICHFTFTSSL